MQSRVVDLGYGCKIMILLLSPDMAPVGTRILVWRRRRICNKYYVGYLTYPRTFISYSGESCVNMGKSTINKLDAKAFLYFLLLLF